MHASMKSGLFICLAYAVACADPAAGAGADADQIVRQAVEAGRRTWRRAVELHPQLTPREMFYFALALCEANQELDKLQRLFDVAARMQDTDPSSPGYGNFRWKWEDGAVMDYNAVEFAMQCAVLIWKRHRQKLADTARQKLKEILELAIEGCLRHEVPPSYTNIALMNAQNLILLGEALGEPDVADEGYRRLERFCVYTWENGIHEYCSPTYYGTDLDCLQLIEAFCQRETGRKQARALLELFWTDIAANWYEPAQRLAGARSRDYDYLHGLGYLDANLAAAGWLPSGRPTLLAALTRWRPPPELRKLSERFPRLVRQTWGVSLGSWRTHYLTADITLSSAGANYGPMDLPLTIDLPGPRDSVRCYLIPDARRDPYGKKKVPAGTHQKALHLRPLFVASQRKMDALALVVYRPQSLPETPATLETHFVMPVDVDEIWVGDRRVDVRRGQPFIVRVDAGEAVVVRKGTAAFGLRVVWSRSLSGDAAPAALVYDANKYGAMRLTVAHHDLWGLQQFARPAGAALWVRIGSGLTSRDAFDRWRRAFAHAVARVEASEEGVSVSAEGNDGELAVGSRAPHLGPSRMEPSVPRVILEIDGEDVGRRILGRLAIVQKAQRRVSRLEAIAVGDKGAHWEAEVGALVGDMAVGVDDDAFGGKYVWAPGEVGAQDSGAGSVTWKLNIPAEGTYYLWARVLAPTSADDSFYVRVFTDSAEPVARAEWHTGQHEKWQWAPVCLNRSLDPTPLPLPSGPVNIQFSVREKGTKVDRLFITDDPRARP